MSRHTQTESHTLAEPHTQAESRTQAESHQAVAHSATAPMAGAPQARPPWERFGWLMGAVWLVFLFFPALALTQSTAQPTAVIIGWFALVTFAAAYLIGFIYGMRVPFEDGGKATLLLLFLGVLVSTLITIPAIGWYATSFVPFIMSYASYLTTPLLHWAVSFCGIAIVACEVTFDEALGIDAPWPLLGIVLMMGAVNTINMTLIRRSVTAEKLQLKLATSEGREAVARDVHDLLGHSLTVVKLKAELAARLLENSPERARAELEDIVRISGEAIDGVRGTVTGIRAERGERGEQGEQGEQGERGELDSDPPTAGLERQLVHSAAALRAAGVACRVQGAASALSPAQALVATWILREATTNVLRHAEARTVTIDISPGTLIVTDDGTGSSFSSGSRSGEPGRLTPGNGVLGMRERAAAAGAEFEIERPTGGGTKVSLTW